ncbi:MAG: serine/threonine-protein kinase [Chlamydiales bacterium]|nr:serine/threonine-protein kinase [Chlamydiales bacterium]
MLDAIQCCCYGYELRALQLEFFSAAIDHLDLHISNPRPNLDQILYHDLPHLSSINRRFELIAKHVPIPHKLQMKICRASTVFADALSILSQTYGMFQTSNIRYYGIFKKQDPRQTTISPLFLLALKKKLAASFPNTPLSFRCISYRGNGILFQASLPEDLPSVVVKTFHKTSVIAYKTLQNEQRMLILARGHPNIIPIYWCGQDKIILPYVKETSATFFSHDENRTWIKLREFAYQVFSGLNHLHGLGICHRDIKPANILVTQNNHVMIADFGFAQLQSHYPAKAKGTPFYAAPEFFLLRRGTPAQDMWAAGVSLFRLITTKRSLIPIPQHCTIDDFFYRLESITQEEIDSIIESSIGTRDVIDLLKKMLQVDPIKRISAKEALFHPFFTAPPVYRPLLIAVLKNRIDYIRTQEK